MTTRRDFIKQTGAGTALLASGITLPTFLSRTAGAMRPERDARVLVVIQLTGGNDGLNTVIPFENDAYHRARPTLRVPAQRVLRLDDDLGLHPVMTGMKRLYDEGLVNVVNNIGYPNPDRSHFRSMDIWHTASTAPEDANLGWLGRVVDEVTVGHDVPAALHLDEGALPLALRTARVTVPSVRTIDSFRLRTAAPDLDRALAGPRPQAGDDLLFVQRVAVSACANARRLETVASDEAGPGRYPAYALAGRLRQIAQLIGADFGPRVYYTSIGGFDTHARQALSHAPLLRELSDSVTAFMDDLRARGLEERVTVMTFSEFGRRVRENGSQGTDHGAGAPMFVLGAGCRGGVTGSAPDLADLDNGDVRYETDFRSVYAAMLRDWLEIDPTPVLGRFEVLPVIRT
jgi:uncharacterized protein (DUF1501 family)